MNGSSKEIAYQVLNECEYATIAMVDENNRPYGLTISPVVIGENIYFHGGLKGKKIDILEDGKEVCVTAAMNVDPVENAFTINYDSVVAYGKVTKIENDGIKIKVMRDISERYTPYIMDRFERAVNNALGVINVFKIEVTEISGKSKFAGKPHVE